MQTETFVFNKLKYFEKVFFKILQVSSQPELSNYKSELKKIITKSINTTISESYAVESVNQEILNAIQLENENEKKHFGSELHDSLGQILASLNFYIDALQHSKALNPDLKNKYLEKVKFLSESALNVSSEVSKGLMSNQITDVGLMDALSDYFDAIQCKHQLKIKFNAHFNEITLSISKKHEVFKIIKTVLNYFLENKYKGLVNIYIGLKYNNILQIEMNHDDLIDLQSLEQFDISGYNNLKHRLELLNANLKLSNDNRLIIKTTVLDAI